MKKFFSITFTIFILLSGMHLSMATHICGGEVAAVKWSFAGEKATCGMESPKQSCSLPDFLTSNCCKNEVVVYTVDNNYSPSFFQLNEVTKNILQVFDIPVGFTFHTITAANSLNTDISPPGNVLVNAVLLSDICTFRI